MNARAEHRAALATLKAEKAPAVTFTPLASTGRPAVQGYAIRRRGNGARYLALNLSETENPTLFFVPLTFNTLPGVGDTTVWGGVAYAIKEADPVSPTGEAIAAKLLLVR